MYNSLKIAQSRLSCRLPESDLLLNILVPIIGLSWTSCLLDRIGYFTAT